MVLPYQKLQDEVFCLTEERNYFQAKFLEQVSELAHLKEELRKAKKEISKLRKEVMGNSNSLHIDTEQLLMSSPRRNKKEDDNSTLTSQEEGAGETTQTTSQGPESEEIEEQESEDNEVEDIRQSAEKLLQWASYRSSVATARTVSSTPDHSSVASPSSRSLMDSVPSTILGGRTEDETNSVDF